MHRDPYLFLYATMLAFGRNRAIRYVAMYDQDSAIPTDLASEALNCAVTYAQMQYGAVRLDDSGSSCEALPHDWLLNQTFQAGYLYMKKNRNAVEMQPPLYVYTASPADFVEFTTYIPGVFQTGSKIEINFESSHTEAHLVINLFDEAENDIVLHMHMHGDSNSVMFDHRIDGSYLQYESAAPSPISTCIDVCVVSFQAVQPYINVHANGGLFYQFDTTNKLPMTLVRKVFFGASQGSNGYLHSISFTADEK